MNEILNPYIAGAPVVETSMFFGREDVFSWIERSLAGKFVDHILVLHGQRRVGKTSVLKQIPNFLPNKYIQVFFDLQGRTNTTLDRFLWWLAREITRTLKQEREISLQRPDREAFANDPDFLINEFIPNLKPLLGDQMLLLTFDEFDTLDQPEIRETLAVPLIAYLRRLMETDWLNFVFSIGSSGDKLENMQASYTDFFKSALYRKISFLTREDCYRLITKPVEGTIQYDRSAVNRIVEITSGHPYFTQLMCHELFSQCQKTGDRRVQLEDVEAILGDVIERGTVNLKFIWDEASDLEKWILAGLAQLEGNASNQAVAQLLREQRVRFSESDLNSGIIHLRDKDVITQDNRFIIHLMRMWLQANRSMDRVREELVEVNPIANRYIEIGDEYRDLGQAERAMESYRQALNVDPGNLKAQSTLASVYLVQRAYPEAAAAFESALKIDDEDVVSRTGYCEAILILGDRAKETGEIDRAIQYYEKILDINTAHTDARQRLADIYREQAETFLVGGKDEEALSAFNRAMGFTPEDDALVARYNQILVEKKAKAIAAWLTRSEQALARRRWDDAAEMVSEALRLDPDNQVLQAKLLEVKDAPRQFKIQAYKTEAEDAIAKGNFEKAVDALETAVLLSPEDTSLRKWLESTRNDQLTAQLNLYRERAARAITAGDWDAAVAAREAALQFSPDDPALVRELAETKTARLQARLDDAQIQAEEALHSQDWDRAIQATQVVMELAPEETYWGEKLTEIKTAQHKAQLDACRSQATSARSAGNLDEAITALEKYLEIEPGDLEIQADIAKIRDEARQHQLASLKNQAKESVAQENWQAAVQAWSRILDLNPDGRTEAEVGLRHAQKYAGIASDYTEAQVALRKKRYGRAIELLQGIIAQDPSYQATSRLLVEAVEANKALPFWRKPWVFVVLGAVVVIVLGVAFGSKLWGTFSSSLQRTPTVGAVTAVATEIASETIVETETEESPPPTATALSTPTFTEPILASIASRSPDFEEDFSSEQDYWDEMYVGPDLLLSDTVSDGVLRFRDNPIVNTYYGFQDDRIFQASDFVLQFDFIPHDYTLGFELLIDMRGGAEGRYSFHMVDSGDWNYLVDSGDWNVRLHDGVTDPILASGSANLEMDQVYTVQLITSGDQFAILWNNELLAYFRDSTFRGDLNTFHFQTALDFQVDFDNIKFWTLNAEETPTQTAEELWTQSPHANSPSEAFPESVIQAACAKCHSIAGFLDFLGADGSTVGIVDSETHPLENIQCETCHSETAPAKDSVVMPSGVELTGLGDEATCMECHQGRNSMVSLNSTITEAAGVNDITEVNPNQVVEGLNYIHLHYDAAAGTRYGTKAKVGGEYEGKTYAGYFAHVPQFDSCIECHDPHSLEVQVEECRGCHGDGDIAGEIANHLKITQGKLLVEIKNYAADVVGVPIGFNPGAYPYYFTDTDDDGTISTGEAVTENGYNSWTPRLLRAAYNYLLSIKEPGAFAHNGKYVIQLLYDSIEDLNPEAVEDLKREYQGSDTLVESNLYAIQDYIEGTNPTFEDDFSSAKPEWGGLGAFYDLNNFIVSYDLDDFVANGVLNLDIERGASEENEVELQGPYGDLLAAADFALQFDYYVEESGENTFIEVDFHWGARYSYVGYNLNIKPVQNTWEMVKFGFPPQVLGSGQIPETSEPSEWHKAQLVVIGDQFAVTLNGERVGIFLDSEWTGDLNRIVVDTDDESAKVKIDNVEFWSLDGVDISAAPAFQNTVTPAPTEVTPAFVGPILEYIATRPPTFEEDFSTSNRKWGYINNQTGDFYTNLANHIGDGILTIKTSDNTLPNETLTFPINNLFKAINFALQYNFSKLVGDFFPTDFGVRFRANQDQNSYYEFYTADRRNFASLNRVDSSGSRETLASEYAPISSDIPQKVLIITVGSQIEIFLNDRLLISIEDEVLSGDTNFFWVDQNMDIAIDDVKFWNLDGVDF